MRTLSTVVVSAVAALAMNIALDTYTDLPMLLRWGIAVVAGLLVTISLSRGFRTPRGQASGGQGRRTP